MRSMSKAFLLIPGARLPKGNPECEALLAREDIRDTLSRVTPAGVSAVTQCLDLGPYRRAPHRIWLWKVLTRERSYPREAPWAWLAMGAREQTPELWALSALRLDAAGRVQGVVSLGDEDFLTLTMALSPVLARAGFRLQMWDNHWFVTRPTNWDLVSTPADVLVGKSIDCAMVGEAAPKTKALLEALLSAAAQHGAAVKGIGTFWLWGGGRHCRFNPPTQIRAVASNEPIILGWANASGILNTFLSAEDVGWSAQTAPGDVIATISTLYEPWLREDWQRWAALLPQTIEAIERYRAAALARPDTDLALVLFGETGSATLMGQAESGGLLSRLLKRKAPAADLTAWIDHYDAPPT